jgi:predicted lipoprotein
MKQHYPLCVPWQCLSIALHSDNKTSSPNLKIYIRNQNKVLELKKNMDNNSKFYEAMKLVTALPKDMQDRLISEIKNIQRRKAKSQLNVGTTVRINHKKVNPTDQFIVEKINRKNVKVKKLNGTGIYTVSPSLLEVIS